MRFCELEDIEFQEFAEANPQANFNQTLAMKKVREDLDLETKLLGIKAASESSEEKIVAAALVAIINSRIKSAGIYYGPLIDFSDKKLLEFWTRNLKEYLNNLGVVHCFINPNFVYAVHDNDGNIMDGAYKADKEFQNLQNSGYLHNGWTMTGTDASNRWHYLKDLSPYFENYEDLIMSFRSTTRQRIRKYKKNNLTVKELNESEIDIFLNLLDDSAKKHGFIPRDRDYFESLIKRFSNDGYLKLLCAFTEDNVPISASLFVIYAGQCIYFHSGNDMNYIKLSGSYALQDYMFKYCLENKIPIYNFLGFDAVFDKPNGVLDFKRGFKGFIEELPGSFELPIKPFKYKLYSILKKRSL
ncbi:MAG: aminoacyltransferase [Bifidobacteriaceae bacterium]|jgi:lipid II:glycine glycyltransferase (peptidoglycan interpeptide bridge formation enzyme)|nr:aminoacyltransferase [Bifidobacteriaceae bacterium]